MERLIDANKLIEYWLTSPMSIGYDDEIEDVNNQPTIEAIPKADYENRLRADLVAMLKELQTEIEGIEKPLCHSATYAKGCVDKGKIEGLIQQKINSLKEKSNEL